MTRTAWGEATPSEVRVDDWSVFRGSPAHKAMLYWMRIHGIDSMTVPADDNEASLVRRNVAGYSIEVEMFDLLPGEGSVGDRLIIENGEARKSTRYIQGEGPPMPFPAQVFK